MINNSTISKTILDGKGVVIHNSILSLNPHPNHGLSLKQPSGVWPAQALHGGAKVVKRGPHQHALSGECRMVETGSNTDSLNVHDMEQTGSNTE